MVGDDARTLFEAGGLMDQAAANMDALMVCRDAAARWRKLTKGDG